MNVANGSPARSTSSWRRWTYLMGLRARHLRVSVATLMQVLTRDIMVTEQGRDATMPLLGAHVLIAAASAQFGVCVRALQEPGIEPPCLVAAAQEVLASARGSGSGKQT